MGRTKAAQLSVCVLTHRHYRPSAIGFQVHTVFTLNPGDIRNLLHIKQSRNAGQKALSEGRVGTNNVGEFALLDILNQKRGIVLRQALKNPQTRQQATLTYINQTVAISS